MSSKNNKPNGFIGVHIGAGYHDPKREKEYKELIFNACLKALQILENCNENSSLRAVEETIAFLEDSPLTNAGKGSCLSIDGHVECDSSIMESCKISSTYKSTFGAIGAVPRIKNPIRFATKLLISQKMNKNRKLALGRICPMMLVGEAAIDWLLNFSDSDLNLELVSKEEVYLRSAKNLIVEEKELITERSRDQWILFSSQLKQANEKKQLAKKRKHFETIDKQEKDSIEISANMENVHDTVGVVAIDKFGNICSGVSSGGIPLKYRGRVGEAGIYGSGCWSEAVQESNTENHILTACSATGTGEHIISSMIAKEVCTQLSKESGEVQQVIQNFMENSFLKDFPRFGGFITLKYNPSDACLDFVWSHSTESMGVGFMSNVDKVPQVFISRMADSESVGKVALTNSFCTSFKQ